MEKIIKFFVESNKGQKIYFLSTLGMLCAFVVGLVLSSPIFWMGRNYDATWMNSVAPYFFYPFFGYVVVVLFLFIPYLWFVANSDKYKGDAKGLMRGMAIFCSIFPGGLIYSFIAKALFIPSGLHNIIGMLLCGWLYLWMMKIIFRKPFTTVQTFIPLC